MRRMALTYERHVQDAFVVIPEESAGEPTLICGVLCGIIRNSKLEIVNHGGAV